MKRLLFASLVVFVSLAPDASGQRNWPVLRDSTMAICILQTSTGSLLVGTMFDGLLRSSDDGATWTTAFRGGCTEYVRNVVHLGNGSIYLATSCDVIVSEDDGASWRRNHIFGMACGSIEWMERKDDTVFFADRSGFWRGDYVDGWRKVSEMDLSTFTMGTDGAVAGQNRDNSHIVRSEDGGVTWEAGCLMPYYSGKLVSAGDGSFFWLLDKTFRISADCRSSEQLVIPDRSGNPQSLESCFSLGSSMYASTMRSLYKSTDFGYTWKDLFPQAGNSLGNLYVDRQGRVYGILYASRLIRSPGPLSTSDEEPAPETFSCRISPNPVRRDAVISMSLRRSGAVDVVLYDCLGRFVKRISETDLPPGGHELRLGIEGLPSGVYHCVVNAPGGSRTLSFVRNE